MDIYKKKDTYLVVSVETNQHMRWSNGDIFYAGSVEDALEGLPIDKFVAVPVCDAPQYVQKEYEQIIDKELTNL
jgi:hypothetical protein